MNVSEARDLDEPFRRISVDKAKEMIDRGGVQIVDVREPDEFATGRVPSSTLIPLDDLLGRSAELQSDADLIFVCSVGVRSALASEMAAAVGCRKVYNMEGGMSAWAAKGYPIER